jgi:hypothetical protein
VCGNLSGALSKDNHNMGMASETTKVILTKISFILVSMGQVESILVSM